MFLGMGNHAVSEVTPLARISTIRSAANSINEQTLKSLKVRQLVDHLCL